MTIEAKEFEDYIRVEDSDGDITDVMVWSLRAWVLTDPTELAARAAESDFDNGDLNDPDDWPRKYKVHLQRGPVWVSVDMEYAPSFSSTIVDPERKAVE